MNAPRLSGGFADPVIESQAVFHAIMQALARPGRAQPLPCAVAPPAPLSREIGTIALTLLDHETRVWLAPALREAPVRQWLGFHTGAPVVEAASEADFVLAPDAKSLPPLSTLQRGNAEYPDLGATVVVGVPSFEGGAAVRLSGPGIDGESIFAPAGLTPGWWPELIAMREIYPLGIDVVFAGPETVAGLPRSTRIGMLEDTTCMSR